MSTTTIEPTIGRVVYYRGADGATRPAILTGVNGAFNVNLHVFGLHSTDTEYGHHESVTHADPEQEPGCLQSWHWMPYQIGQAKKAATELSRANETKTTDARANWAGCGLDFGTALLALKDGKRVARAGWNGKGMFVYLVPAASYPVQTGAAKAHFGEGAMVPYNAYLALKGVDDTVSTWAPSGSDALAEDWLTVD